MKRHVILKSFLMAAVMVISLVFTDFGSVYAAPNGKGVGSLSELNQAIADGEENIYLTGDIDIPGYLTIRDKKLRLDLNGHTINLNVNNTQRSNIKVYNSNFTVCDSSSEGEGCIKSGYVLGGYGGAIYVSGGTFTFESGTICESRARWGAGVSISNGATFNMTGGVIERNYIVGTGDGMGGGVVVSGEGTKFNMSGGAIRGNQEETARKNKGGGVAVCNGAVFTMTGGRVGDHTIINRANSISGNGAGVYVKNATFNLNGGTVENNTTTANGGGIYLCDDAKLSMTAPEALFYNRTTGNGSAVYIENADCTIVGTRIFENNAQGDKGGTIYIDEKQTKTIIISDTIIENNICGNNGGAIYLGGAGLGLNNVTVKGNEASVGNGAGIYVADKAILNMTGGSIKDNLAKGADRNPNLYGLGGAICIMDSSSVTLSDVEISANTANDGGGIYIDDSASCNLSNVSITGNAANSYRSNNEYVGGGITAKGQINIGGKIIVEDNVSNNSNGTFVRNSNVLLDNDSLIKIIKPLDDDSNIGVGTTSAGDKRITQGYGSDSFTTWKQSPDNMIFSDATGRYIQKNPALTSDSPYYDEAYIMNTKHRHSMGYIAPIEATCKDYGKKAAYRCDTCNRIYEDENGITETREQDLKLDKNPYNHVGPAVYKKETVNEEPTCFTAGKKTTMYKCDYCGEEMYALISTIEPYAHEWEEISSTDESGTRYGWRCKKCFTEVWGENPACTHFLADENEERIIQFTAEEADCTNCGLNAFARCADCRTYFQYGTTHADDDLASKILTKEQVSGLVIPALGHLENDDWITDQSSAIEASCNSEGSYYQYKKCGRNGCDEIIAERTVTVPKLGHEYGEYYNDGCAICRKCERCDEVEVVGYSHNYVESEKLEPTCTADGHKQIYVCTDCGQIIDYKSYHDSGKENKLSYSDVLISKLGHSYGDWEMIEEPTADSKGVEIRTCERCGNIEKRDSVIEVTYGVTEGEGATWVLGGTGTLGFKTKRSYDDEGAFSEWFTGEVRVDGKKLDTDAYTASEGCVKVDLKDSFLNTLSVGKHTVTIVFKDTLIDASFTVKEADNAKDGTTNNKTKSPETGDRSPIGLCLAGMLFTLLAMIVLESWQKKQKI